MGKLAKKVNPIQLLTGIFSPKTIKNAVMPDQQQAAPAPAPAPVEAPAANLPPPPPMPTPDDDAVKLAKRRSAASQRLRRGRLSTIFTDPQTGSGLGG